MSTTWPLRQAPDDAVIFATSLLADRTRLEYVILGYEGDWMISDGSPFGEDSAANHR